LGGKGHRVGWDAIRRDVSYFVDGEFRRTAQNQEGGQWNGRNPALLSIRGGSLRHLNARTFGVALTVQVGLDGERGTGLGLMLSARGRK
jgi:hypothetical protein